MGAKIISRFRVEVPPLPDFDGEPWGFDVIMPARAVAQEIEAIIIDRNRRMLQLYTDPTVEAAVAADDDRRLTVALASKASSSGSVDYTPEQRARLVDLVAPCCRTPDGFDPPVAWDDIRREAEAVYELIMSMVAESIFDRLQGAGRALAKKKSPPQSQPQTTDTSTGPASTAKPT